MESADLKLNYSGLFNLLEQNNMNRNALVKKAGLTHNAILSIKNGEPIAMSALLKICAFFHCDISDVVKIDYDSADNMSFMFRQMVENLKASENKRILLHKGNEFCTFWIADIYGYPAYPLIEMNLDMANKVSDVTGIRDLAEDMAQRAIKTVERFNMDDPVLNDPPEITNNNALDTTDGTWYNCYGVITNSYGEDNINGE